MNKISRIILLITNLKNLDDKSEYTFSKFPIKIGRDSGCSLALRDERKLLSRNHAKIILIEEKLKLIDLDSRNGTFINQNKIIPNKEYELKQNDVMEIGEYQLQITNISKEHIRVDDPQKTMVFSSPFVEDVVILADSLKKLSIKYSTIKDQMKNEYLRMDFLNFLNKIEYSNVTSLLSEYLIDNNPNENDYTKKPQKSELKLINKNPLNISNESNNDTFEEGVEKDYSLTHQITDSFDTLLEMIIKLIQGYWQFRLEFFGVTIYQSIPTTSVEELKGFLFDSSATEEESKKRLKIFKEELNKVLSHQIGLLDGYKGSINDGIDRVLKEVDPIEIEDKINSKKIKIGSLNIPYKYIPFYAKIKSMQVIKSFHSKLRLDKNVIEKKHFRQAFINGYQKRIHFGKDNE